MKTLIIVKTKKDYKQAKQMISKQLDEQGIDYSIDSQTRSIVHKEGKHRIDFVIDNDKKSEVEQGAKYNKVITWKRNK